MKHVIVEGPDGAGKTNLVRELVDHLGIPQHPRFVQSTGGPPRNLDALVMADLVSPMYGPDHPHVYDRHPLISEPIYGPIIRGGVDGMFRLVPWLDRCRKKLQGRAVVVFCLPPWEEVQNNVVNPDIEQMDGVAQEIWDIYNAYAQLYDRWGGPKLAHDYTRNPPGSMSRTNLITRVRLMMREDSPL